MKPVRVVMLSFVLGFLPFAAVPVLAQTVAPPANYEQAAAAPVSYTHLTLPRRG